MSVYVRSDKNLYDEFRLAHLYLILYFMETIVIAPNKLLCANKELSGVSGKVFGVFGIVRAFCGSLKENYRAVCSNCRW